MIYVTHDQVEAMTLADKIIVLNNGRIEQSGSPLDLYHRPRNLFVAGFIGSPKMNFLPGHIKANEGARAVIALDAGKTLAIEAKGLNPGDKVTVGIRPENVMIDSGDAASLDGSVSVVEHLGGQTVVYAQLPDGDQFTIQMDGGVEIKPGDRIRAGIPSNRVHLFSASGEVL
jgi:multiple sugar transport system ATP-binding protein